MDTNLLNRINPQWRKALDFVLRPPGTRVPPVAARTTELNRAQVANLGRLLPQTRAFHEDRRRYSDAIFNFIEVVK
jgi:hypothetical protein